MNFWDFIPIQDMIGIPHKNYEYRHTSNKLRVSVDNSCIVRRKERTFSKTKNTDYKNQNSTWDDNKNLK
jgi:hypothetical protein